MGKDRVGEASQAAAAAVVVVVMVVVVLGADGWARVVVESGGKGGVGVGVAAASVCVGAGVGRKGEGGEVVMRAYKEEGPEGGRRVEGGGFSPGAVGGTPTCRASITGLGVGRVRVRAWDRGSGATPPLLLLVVVDSAAAAPTSLRRKSASRMSVMAESVEGGGSAAEEEEEEEEEEGGGVGSPRLYRAMVPSRDPVMS
jgi:hypothetical protein